MSSSPRYVQWSTEAASISTASCHPGARAQLVAVHAEPEALRAARLEHRPRLVGVEGAVLAEHVDPAGVRRAGLEHRAADELDVLVGAALELRRDDVRAHERHVVGEPRRDLAEAPLGVDVEPVARLDLQVRDPGTSALRPPALGQLDQLRIAGGPRRLSRHPDPAGLVRPPCHARRELVGAVAGEDEMCVAVDEPRDDAAAGRVEALVAGRSRPGHRRDPVALDHEGGVPDEPQRPLAQLRVVCDQQTDVVDDERAHA